MTAFFFNMNKKYISGFTLLELLVVVSITAVLGASAGIFYARFLTQSNVNLATDQIAGQLRKAQMYAIEDRKNTSWGVKYASNKITLFATGNAAFDESFDVSSSLSITNLSSVTFAKRTGIPDVTPTITISGNGQSKTVNINSQGVVNK
jgi:prepilin-type N-terminal cleavage/methylation domain-containing protein